MSETQFSQNQVAVFGRDRMIDAEKEPASAAANQQLLHTIMALAVETRPVDANHIYLNTFERAIGRPLVAQVNIHDIRGSKVAEEESAIATVYRLKNRDIRIWLPRTGLYPGNYEEDEAIYIDHNKRAKIYKRFSPLEGTFWRNLTYRFAAPIAARKYASESEVQEALDIISSVVSHHDEAHSNEITKNKK